jgi:hypothetical protein
VHWHSTGSTDNGSKRQQLNATFTESRKITSPSESCETRHQRFHRSPLLACDDSALPRSAGWKPRVFMLLG